MCSTIQNFQRIVHLDLKGAPLKLPYLEQVLFMAKSWGATGFLLEWEDTFPYSGEISKLGSLENSGGDGMYSPQEVQHIFQFARNHGLIAIQLVQTIGHLEFVLKHRPFNELREIQSSPAVICPTKEKTHILIRMMIDQALDAQPDAQYFHIGADEVWYKIQCSDCQEAALRKQFAGDGVFLEYIRNICLYIKSKRPNLTILMWDDMLRPIPQEAFAVYDLSYIQPVYWYYTSLDKHQTDHVLWSKYINVFPKIWAASAFKGANGSCQMVSPVSRYLGNHEAWVRDIKMYKDNIQFAGIILTGWSRYDHYATLCELMPVMLPSLASCLRYIINSEFVAKDLLVNELLPSNEWPGEELARRIHAFVMVRDRCMALLNGDEIATWLNPWQVERQFTVCIHVQSIAYSAHVLVEELKNAKKDITPLLSEITGKRSTEEWIGTNITPLFNKIFQIFDVADQAMARDGGIRALRE